MTEIKLARSIMLDFPKLTCQACKKEDWYYRPAGNSFPTGEWICLRCHPPGDKVMLLKARTMLANRKLYLAWFALTGGVGGVLDEEGKEVYNEGCQRARALAQELKEAGSTDCLYIENGKKLKKCNVMPSITSKPSWDGFFCHACPNEYWYVKELLEYDKMVAPEDWKE